MQALQDFKALYRLLSPNLGDIVFNDFLNGGFGGFGIGACTPKGGGGGTTALRGLGLTFKGTWGWAGVGNTAAAALGAEVTPNVVVEY